MTDNGRVMKNLMDPWNKITIRVVRSDKRGKIRGAASKCPAYL